MKSKRIKSFFKLNIAKIIISILIIIFFILTLGISDPWKHQISPFPLFLFLPILLTKLFAFILIFPFSYLLACIIVSLFNHIKKRKFLSLIIILIILFLSGIDEPLINNTVNKPDYVCSTDSDCIVKSISKSYCGNPRCINKDWDYYDSRINSVFALSCRTVLISCSCVENKCNSKDLYKSTNLEDCEKLEGYKKNECIRTVSYNINKTV